MTLQDIIESFHFPLVFQMTSWQIDAYIIGKSCTVA